GRPALVAAMAVLVAVAAACSGTDVPESLPGPTTSTTEAPAPPPEAADPTCTNGVDGTVVRSLRPGADAEQALATRSYPGGSYMAGIQQRGRLRVGVDASTQLFSSVDPRTGGFEGFDADIAREMARVLLGSPDLVEFVAIPYSQRVDILADPEGPGVDMVIDTFTINCARDDQIDFSSVYFNSTQKLLVRSDEDAQSIAELGGRRVCAAANSTSIENLAALPDPKPVPVPVADQADCLVLLQQGRVDAISTDDTILAGMAAQDPNVRIVGDPFSEEPYGIGLPPGHPEYVQLVNAALEEMRTSGRWAELYAHWLPMLPSDTGGQPPAPRYED
ncbi:MAG TPA: glutamate ABC transporter substrate-binding protein, partial [Acidimicrobiales bacterium]|nr:glutamate ABC transporter substrate-binding protein [Acidimicrobiales bacterium]